MMKGKRKSDKLTGDALEELQLQTDDKAKAVIEDVPKQKKIRTMTTTSADISSPQRSHDARAPKNEYQAQQDDEAETASVTSVGTAIFSPQTTHDSRALHEESQLYQDDEPETVASILQKEQNELATVFHPEPDQADFLGVDTLRMSPQTSDVPQRPTSSGDGDIEANGTEGADDAGSGSEAENSDVGLGLTIITERSGPDDSSCAFARPSANAADKEIALHKIATEWKGALEDLFNPGLQPQPIRPAMQWDTKLVKALAKIAFYTTYAEVNRLLWVQVRQRTIMRAFTSVTPAEVYAVIEEMNKHGFKPKKVADEEFYA